MFTIRTALEIQAQQLDHYCTDKPYGEAIRAKIAEKTNIEGLDLDEDLPSYIINRHVPRGGAIEVLVYAAMEAQQKRNRDSLRLEEVHSREMHVSIDDMPDDLELWTDELLKPLGTQITALVFRSDDPESRYYGRNWVCTSISINRPQSHTTTYQEPWEDFAAALLRA